MDVKIGMNLLLWGTEITPEIVPVLAALAEAGFDGVEIPLIGQSTKQLKDLSDACDSLGLQRSSSAFMDLQHNPISSDPATRMAAQDHLKRTVDDASILGADRVVGGLYQAHKYFTGSAGTLSEWSWSAECMHAMGEYAARSEVQICLEFLNRFEAFLICTSSECKQMVDQIGLSNVGLHYDTHHANIEDPDPVVALSSVKDVINHVHLSESHRGTLGTGQVDWAATFQGLKAIDYQGWLVIESFGMDDQKLCNAANIWRNAFSTKEEVYLDGIKFIKGHM